MAGEVISNTHIKQKTMKLEKCTCIVLMAGAEKTFPIKFYNAFKFQETDI